jgi:putative ABC transport system permease protein
VVKDALMLSPFSKPDPTMFMYGTNPQDNLIYRLAPNVNAHTAVNQLNRIFAKYNPAYPYTYRFVDDDYNQKFGQEVLIGKLSGIFAVLILDSNLLTLSAISPLYHNRTPHVT